MRPFKFVSNQYFQWLTFFVMHAYETFNLTVLLRLVFDNGNDFKVFVDWFMINRNIDYGHRNFDFDVSLVMHREAYGVMKLYHKNYDTRSIAFIFRNVMTFVFRYILIHDRHQWEIFRDNVIFRFRQRSHGQFRRSFRENFRLDRFPSNNSTFSTNIPAVSSFRVHRIAIYDEFVDCIGQIIRRG